MRVDRHGKGLGNVYRRVGKDWNKWLAKKETVRLGMGKTSATAKGLADF